MVATRHLFNTVHACFGWFCAKERIMAAGYAKFSPLCQVVSALRRVCLGRSSYGSYSNLWLSLCPPIKSGPGICQPILKLLKYLARFSQCPAGILPGLSTYATPCAQNQNGTGHLRLMVLLMALTANHGNAMRTKWVKAYRIQNKYFGLHCQLD